MKSFASLRFSWKREVNLAKVVVSGFHFVIIGSAISSVLSITDSEKLGREGEGDGDEVIVSLDGEDILLEKREFGDPAFGEKHRLLIPFLGI